MNGIAHMLNIGTLATWLSVAGFGTVGLIVPNPHMTLDARPVIAETQVIPQDFTLGGESMPAVQESSAPAETIPAEIIPAPPDMPDLAALPPLPPLPEVPEVTPTPRSANDFAAALQRPASAEAAAHPARRATGKSAASNIGAPAAGHGLTNAARLAAGNMPPPDYPVEARRQGQTGTLLVDFTVDTSGKVIAAYAKKPSPWPLLNQEAVRAVRRWTFPPGVVMQLQRSIVFQLN
jgi:protein TonB